jgi:sigma-E factor negative regulatory protein RseA
MQYFESESMSMQEQLSALHDGELSHEQAAALVRASLADESVVLQWRSMSAIGSVLRQQQGGLASKSVSLGAEAVRQEAVVFAQDFVPMPEQAVHQAAANDGVFRWKMVAGVAALAAVGSLVWGLLGATADKAGLSQGGVLAGNPSAPSVSSASVQNGSPLIVVNGQIAGQEAAMIRDPRLDELLAAHKQFGGVSALQQPAGSLRSVSIAVQRP